MGGNGNNGMLKTFYNSKQSASGVGGSTTVSSSGGVANNINIIPSGNIYSNNNNTNYVGLCVVVVDVVFLSRENAL